MMETLRAKWDALVAKLPTGFVAPYWGAYTGWLVAHPNTAGALVLAFAVLAIF